MNDLVSQLPLNSKKKPKVRPLSSIKQIIVHTTDWDIAPLELAKYDIGPNHIDSTGCPSITYHYLIEKDGTVSRTAKEEWVTWHAGGHNSNSLSIALVYKTDPAFESGKGPYKVNFTPTQEMLIALDDLLVDLCKKFRIPPTEIYGHRELIGTGFILFKGHKRLRKTCPGMSVDLDELRETIILRLQQEMLDHGFYKGIVDGHWGNKSKLGFQKLLDYKG